MKKLVLRDDRTPTTRHELTVSDHEGGLRIDEWELGDLVERVAGAREQEWVIEVGAGDIPALIVALGGDAGEDVFDVIRRTCAARPEHLRATLISKSVPHHVAWHRLGD